MGTARSLQPDQYSNSLLDYPQVQSSISRLLMSRQHQKRPLEDNPSPPEPLQDNAPFKKIKTGHRPRQQHPEVQTSPPSSPPRSEDSRPANEHKTIAPTLLGAVIPLTRQALKKFDEMSSRRSKKPSGSSSRGLETTTVSSTKPDRVVAHSNSFPQILQDRGIYPNGDLSVLADREELQRERSVRSSLAPSQCSDGEIEDIMEANANAATEPDIERDVVPAIAGRRHRLPRSGNVSWTNMTSMTESLTVAPQPDLYYGTRVGDISKPVRDSIGHLIIPSTVPNAPASPHFILENKGPAGSLEVVKRQAAHSAAAAARAAFALENLGVDDPVYHNATLAHAWTYTSSSGDLTQYAMRVSRPEPGSSQPGYHLTHVKTHHITESKEQFRRGVSAFRHCRDESHAKNQERLAKATERLQRLNEQASHRDTISGPAQEEISVAAPPIEAQQEDANDGSLTSGYHGSTLPPHVPALDGDMTTHEYYALLDQQLQEDCAASFSERVGFHSLTAITSMTSVSTVVTASPDEGASNNSSLFGPKRNGDQGNDNLVKECRRQYVVGAQP